MKIKNILTSKRLYFIVIIYPLLIILSRFIMNNFAEHTNASNYYGYIMLVISALIVALALIEIIKRLVGYQLQGDKLKMRQREGINMNEFK